MLDAVAVYRTIEAKGKELTIIRVTVGTIFSRSGESRPPNEQCPFRHRVGRRVRPTIKYKPMGINISPPTAPR